MKGDIPLAAFRLMAALPVHTHRRDAAFIRRKNVTFNDWARPVRVGKRVFKSLTEAKKKLRISPKTLYAMLARKEAFYEQNR